jgi:hypothetical protein
MIARREFLMQTAGVVALGAKERAGYALPVLAGQPAPSTAGAAPLVTFDLEITITGLCLFLEAPSKMHVLMVRPRGNVERHYPRVFYDAAHDSGISAGTLYRVVPLEGTILDLSGLTPPGPIPPISAIPKLLDVSKYTTHKLKDPVLFPPPNLACRLSLPAGSPQTPDRVGPWKLTATTNPTVPVVTQTEAAWKVVWTVSGIQGNAMNWQLNPSVPGTPVELLPPLQPITIGGNKVIRLTISNVVRGESYHEPPKCVAPNTNAKLTHFHAFRDLYANSGSWPDLIYTGTTPPVCPPSGPSGTPYTCLPSGGH